MQLLMTLAGQSSERLNMVQGIKTVVHQHEANLPALACSADNRSYSAFATISCLLESGASCRALSQLLISCSSSVINLFHATNSSARWMVDACVCAVYMQEGMLILAAQLQ